MASLQNAQIDQSYGALLKTDDNGNITATPKAITDGAGNATNIQIGTTETKFPSGTVDFTGSTVNGLPDSGVQSVVAGTNVTVDATDPANPIVSASSGGAAGLVSGSVNDSMKSADALTTNGTVASGFNSIALGNGATCGGFSGLAIGNNATQSANDGIAIGSNANAASMVLQSDQTQQQLVTKV